MENFKILSSKILLAAFIYIVIFTMSGCKKCRECTAKAWDGSISTAEKCGTGPQVQSFENDFKLNHLLYEVECHDK
jgi:hypothetical protein